jgi:hypothetical protein
MSNRQSGGILLLFGDWPCTDQLVATLMRSVCNVNMLMLHRKPLCSCRFRQLRVRMCRSWGHHWLAADIPCYCSRILLSRFPGAMVHWRKSNNTACKLGGVFARLMIMCCQLRFRAWAHVYNHLMHVSKGRRSEHRASHPLARAMAQASGPSGHTQALLYSAGSGAAATRTPCMALLRS